jgi:hypothetical protein
MNQNQNRDPLIADIGFEDQEAGIETEHAVALAYDAEENLYVALTGKNGKVYLGTYDEDGYLRLAPVGGAARTNAAPSLTL